MSPFATFIIKIRMWKWNRKYKGVDVFFKNESSILNFDTMFFWSPVQIKWFNFLIVIFLSAICHYTYSQRGTSWSPGCNMDFASVLSVKNKRPMAWSLNPFPHNDTFWRPWETSLLKTLWEKERLLVTSNFSVTDDHSFKHGCFPI